MLLNDEIVDIEKADGICLPTFALNGFKDYFYIQKPFLLNIQDLLK